MSMRKFLRVTGILATPVDYHIAGVAPETSSPTGETGTLRVPTDFASAQGYTLNSSGRLVVSGNTSSNAESLTEIGGSSVLGYSPSHRWLGEGLDCARAR